MAGDRALPIQECPDQFYYVNFHFVINDEANVDTYLHYCERDTVLDAAHIICTTGDADAVFALYKAEAGVTIGGGADTTANATETAITSNMTHVLAEDKTVEAFEVLDGSGSLAATNVVEAGRSIVLQVETAASTAVAGTIQLRLRTRVR